MNAAAGFNESISGDRLLVLGRKEGPFARRHSPGPKWTGWDNRIDVHGPRTFFWGLTVGLAPAPAATTHKFDAHLAARTITLLAGFPDQQQLSASSATRRWEKERPIADRLDALGACSVRHKPGYNNWRLHSVPAFCKHTADLPAGREGRRFSTVFQRRPPAGEGPTPPRKIPAPARRSGCARIPSQPGTGFGPPAVSLDVRFAGRLGVSVASRPKRLTSIIRCTPFAFGWRSTRVQAADPARCAELLGTLAEKSWLASFEAPNLSQTDVGGLKAGANDRRLRRSSSNPGFQDGFGFGFADQFRHRRTPAGSHCPTKQSDGPAPAISIVHRWATPRREPGLEGPQVGGGAPSGITGGLG